MKIVTIAIGEAHLKMAYMLAASVYGKHKMWIITDQPIEHSFLFEKVLKPFVIGATNYETALRNKLMLDKVAPCLFMDADSLLFKKVDFRDLQQFESISLPERTTYPSWVDVEKAKSIYGLKKYWRHNTSWMYLDGGNMSKWIFQKARSVYEDFKNGLVESKEFHGTINDEPCIDIAVSYAIGQFKVPYKVNVPLYLPFFKFEGSHHTVNSYYGISIAGKTKNMDAVNFYNSWVEYFAKAVGIEPCYFNKSAFKDFNDSVPQVVDACNVEFGYELLSALPYAYHLHQKGMLLGTVSGIDTDCLYWFSPNHTINPEPRHWNNMKKASKVLPNIAIHNHELDWRYFGKAPLKARWGWQLEEFDKPIVCICNRINIEWGKDIINYFDLDCLEQMFIALGEKYQVVYFNIASKKEYADGVDMLEIGDYDLARKHGAIVIHDLCKQYPEYTLNEMQLMLFAMCERFIAMNGGYSILASYFGGTNIIYSKECREIEPHVNSFYRWYHKLGDSRIIHVDNYEALHETIDTVYVQEKPLVNILIRTHNRPKAFKECYESIISQTYKNVNIIVGYHDEVAHGYLIPYKVKPVRYEKFRGTIPSPPNDTDYGKPFAHNHYLDLLNKEVSEGWIMYLDDDDAFEHENALETIVNSISSDNDLLMWRIMLNNGVILPSDENFGKEPVARGISGITFMAHSKHVKQTSFEPYRWGDYRVIKALYGKLKHVFINECLTKMQKGHCGMGAGLDL